MALIYIVEDDENIREIETIALKNSNYMVCAFEKATTFYKKLEDIMPDLVLLDVMLPDESGYDIVRKLRKNPATKKLPVIMVTAKTAEMDMIKGLDEGADDYIKKPFSIAELRARVNAHLRREARSPVRTMNRGGVRFDMQAKEAFAGERTLPLTRGEYAICEHLALHAGQVFTKEQLYDAVFGFDAGGDPSAIAEHVKNIRAKLKAEGLSPVETVWGVGYKWQKNSVL